MEYDVLDIDEPRFVEEFASFQRVVQDLERRLASVIIQVGGCGGGARHGVRGRRVAALPGR